MKRSWYPVLNARAAGAFNHRRIGASGTHRSGLPSVAFSSGLLALALLAGCVGPQEVAVQTVGGGEWRLAAKLDSGVLLVRSPRASAERARSGSDRDGTPPAVAVLLLPARGDPLPLEGSLVSIVLPGTDGGTAPSGNRVTFGRVEYQERNFYISVPTVSPSTLRTIGRGSASVFEAQGDLWSIDDGGVVRRLTAHRIRGFDREVLSRSQREGTVILYWAAVPTLDPRGGRIAFVTNREAVQAGRPGQSIWLLEAGGEEYPILSEPGRSFRPAGWLSGELLFIGDEPGVFSIDPATREQRRLSSGVLLDASSTGSAILVADRVPEEPQLIWMTETESRPLPRPPEGLLFSPQALLSPNGSRALLQLAAAAGERRRFVLWTADRNSLDELPVDASNVVDWPSWVDDSTLLVRAGGPSSASSVLVRLPD